MVNTALRERVWQQAGRQAQPSLAIIDSQRAKTTEVGGVPGFDGAKRVNGRKRHILPDTMGNLLKVLAHAANIGERAGAEQLRLEVSEKLWSRLEKILADSGCEGADFQAWVAQTFEAEWEISLRPTGRKGLVLVPMRWVVERTLAWLGHFRRLSKDYERLTENSQGIVYLAQGDCIKIQLNYYGPSRTLVNRCFWLSESSPALSSSLLRLTIALNGPMRF